MYMLYIYKVMSIYKYSYTHTYTCIYIARERERVICMLGCVWYASKLENRFAVSMNKKAKRGE